jgi:VanZ family protein
MTIFLRLIAWTLAVAVTFVTLGPAQFRPHAHLGQNGEHALAFILLGLSFGLAYRQKRVLVGLVAVVMTGAIEILQFWAPGRHARLSDFFVDALAACAGLAMAAALDRIITRNRAQTR